MNSNSAEGLVGSPEISSEISEFFSFYTRNRIRIPFRRKLQKSKLFHNIDPLVKFIGLSALYNPRPIFTDEYGLRNVVALPQDFYIALKHILHRATENLNKLLGLTKIAQSTAVIIWDIIKEGEPLTSQTLKWHGRITERVARSWLERFTKKNWLVRAERKGIGGRFFYEKTAEFGVFSIEVDMDKLADATEEWLAKHNLDVTFRRDYAQPKFSLVIRMIPNIWVKSFPEFLFEESKN